MKPNWFRPLKWVGSPRSEGGSNDRHRLPHFPSSLESWKGSLEVPWCTTPIEAESSLGPDSHHPIISLSGIPSAAAGPSPSSSITIVESATRRVQKHKRTQDWRAGPFRSSSTCGGPQISGVSEAISAIRVPPYAQGKHRSATRCHAPGRRPGSRPGPHLDQNVLAGYAEVALASTLASRAASFPTLHGPDSDPLPPFGANVALENRD